MSLQSECIGQHNDAGERTRSTPAPCQVTTNRYSPDTILDGAFGLDSEPRRCSILSPKGPPTVSTAPQPSPQRPYLVSRPIRIDAPRERRFHHALGVARTAITMLAILAGIYTAYTNWEQSKGADRTKELDLALAHERTLQAQAEAKREEERTKQEEAHARIAASFAHLAEQRTTTQPTTRRLSPSRHETIERPTSSSAAAPQDTAPQPHRQHQTPAVPPVSMQSYAVTHDSFGTDCHGTLSLSSNGHIRYQGSDPKHSFVFTWEQVTINGRGIIAPKDPGNPHGKHKEYNFKLANNQSKRSREIGIAAALAAWDQQVRAERTTK